MIALLIILGLVLALLLVFWFANSDEVCSRASLDQVRDELFVADQRIDGEFHRARHAMNDAVGQSWRNLAG